MNFLKNHGWKMYLGFMLSVFGLSFVDRPGAFITIITGTVLLVEWSKCS